MRAGEGCARCGDPFTDHPRRGLCLRCYRRARGNGTLDQYPTVERLSNGTCRLCPAGHYAKGLCRRHYEKARRRNGRATCDLCRERPAVAGTDLCTVCERADRTRFELAQLRLALEEVAAGIGGLLGRWPTGSEHTHRRLLDLHARLAEHRPPLRLDRVERDLLESP